MSCIDSIALQKQSYVCRKCNGMVCKCIKTISVKQSIVCFPKQSDDKPRKIITIKTTPLNESHTNEAKVIAAKEGQSMKAMKTIKTIKTIKYIQSYTDESVFTKNAGIMQKICNFILNDQVDLAFEQALLDKHFNPEIVTEHNVKIDKNDHDIVVFFKRGRLAQRKANAKQSEGNWEPHHIDLACEMLALHLASDIMEFVMDHDTSYSEMDIYKFEKWYCNLQLEIDTYCTVIKKCLLNTTN